MYILTMQIGTSNWTFTYKEPSDADKAFKAVKKYQTAAHATVGAEPLEMEDDFGLKAVINIPVDAVQLSNLEKCFEGQAIVGLFQARAQGKLQAMAQRDPQLMFLNANAGAKPNGSGIIRPGG